MNPRDVWILYRRELTAALRERGIVWGSILTPLLLYPLMLWGAFSMGGFLSAQEERFSSRIALVELPDEHSELRARVREQGPVELVEAPPREDRREAVTAGEIDAVAKLRPAAGESGLEEDFRLEVLYDGSKDRSVKARERLEAALEEYRTAWLERRAEAAGLTGADWEQFRVERRNLASGGEMGAFVLGLIAPLLMIIMMAVGCFYPAVDATAGERERSTWETLMTVSASRSSIVTAKFLYVATLGTLAGLLNLGAMILTLRAVLAPQLGAGAFELSVPWSALPLVILSAVLLALFLAAGMMLFAAFARTFKEGQSMVSPFYMLVILPAMFVMSPDLELDVTTALIPVANVALLMRGAIAGSLDAVAVAVTLAVEAALVVATLALARYVLRFEDALLGSYGGSLGKFLKARLRGRREVKA